MDLMFIPFVVAFSASGFVALRLFKESKDDKGMALGAAITVFIVSLSITRTIVVIPFGEILKLLAGGLFPALLFAGAGYFHGWMEGKKGDPKGEAFAMFLGVMFLWLIAIGFVGGGRDDYNECHDAGPWGIYTVCE